MKNICCLLVLLICLIQVVAIIPSDSVVAVDNIEEDPEFISLSSEKMKIIYENMTNIQNTYFSQIYQYENFMESYFDNLTINHGFNESGSCGYIGIDMLLSYYDTFLSDNIVQDKYDKPSKGTCHNMICRRSSPGSLSDEPEGFDNDNYLNEDGELNILQRNIGYYNYVTQMKETSLHAKLLTIGHSLGFYNYYWDDTPASLGHSGVKFVIKQYLYEVLGFNYGQEYTIEDIKTSLINDSDDVRAFVIQKIQHRNPVMLSIEDEDGEGHWVIAYDYDAVADKIYCNFGWGGDATHVSPENYKEELHLTDDSLKPFYKYKTALVINFAIPHEHSNNYEVTERIGDVEITHYYCYDSSEIELYSNPLVNLTTSINDHTYRFNCGCDFVQNHIDYFEAETSGHLLTCKCCDYERLYSHEFTHTSIDALQHSSKCTNESCEMEFTYNHSWRFVSVDEITHTATCRDCGYTETKSHNLEYYNITSTHHTYGCTDCNYSVTSEHDMYLSMSVESGKHGYKCHDCGYVDESTVGTHSYDYWIYVDNTTHRSECGCGARGDVIAPHAFVPVKGSLLKVVCVDCGYTKRKDSDFGNVIMSITKVSTNGSYILPDGTIMLVDEDIDAYLNGTLVFYDKSNVPQTQ